MTHQTFDSIDSRRGGAFGQIGDGRRRELGLPGDPPAVVALRDLSERQIGTFGKTLQSCVSSLAAAE